MRLGLPRRDDRWIGSKPLDVTGVVMTAVCACDLASWVARPKLALRNACAICTLGVRVGEEVGPEVVVGVGVAAGVESDFMIGADIILSFQICFAFLDSGERLRAGEEKER